MSAILQFPLFISLMYVAVSLLTHISCICNAPVSKALTGAISVKRRKRNNWINEMSWELSWKCIWMWFRFLFNPLNLGCVVCATPDNFCSALFGNHNHIFCHWPQYKRLSNKTADINKHYTNFRMVTLSLHRQKEVPQTFALPLKTVRVCMYLFACNLIYVFKRHSFH